jgi:hypothetical protein
MWEIFTLGRVLPYKDHSNHEVSKSVPKGLREDPPSECPQSVSQLMKMCWARDPGDRPSFRQIVTYLESEGKSAGMEMMRKSSERFRSIELMAEQSWFRPMIQFLRDQKIANEEWSPLLRHIQIETLSENISGENGYVSTEMSRIHSQSPVWIPGKVKPEFFY